MSGATIRPATLADAEEMAVLIDYAGEGLPSHLWAGMAEGDETPLYVGIRRARRDEGSFSWRNAWIAESDGHVAGMLTGYPIAEPSPVEPGTPSLFAALQELENEAPGSWYVNVLACHPEFRNRGIGSALMRKADDLARESGIGDLSVIVFDTNRGARRLYERHGYVERAARGFEPGGWETANRGAILLVKALGR